MWAFFMNSTHNHPIAFVVQLHSLIFDVYEQSKAQIRFVPDALDFAFVVVQMHRALAKLEKKTEKLAEAS
jgi:hypothetical protein